MGLTSGVGCVGGAQRDVGPWSFFFGLMLEAILFALGGMLGGFWEPKWRPKSIFGRFFFDAFFECVLASILERVLKARTLKDHDFPMGKP